MSHTTYIPDTNHKTADMEQAGQAVVGVDAARSGEGVPGAQWGSDAAADASFQRMAASIPGGVSPRGFGADIDAGHHRLGNRAFLRWVGELQGSGQSAQSLADEMAAGPMLPTVSRVAVPGPLQLMPKKKKKVGQSASAATPEAGGTAMSGADVETIHAPVEAAAVTLPQTESEPGEAAAPEEKKKKKKSRVQVALNTLRAEGVEAFKSYIDAEIREAELLHTLAERIGRAQDLGDNKEAARRVVEARLRVLDPESVPVIAQAAGPGPELGRTGPDIAPVKTVLNPREDELFARCESGNVRRLKQLLRYGKIDINMGSEYGTLLCLASYNGHAGIIRELLSMPGIDVNLAHDNGMTPLYFAAQGGHAEAVRLLLDVRGINVNSAAHTGATPLYVAAQNGRVGVVKLLLAAHGIKVNLAQMTGAVPLCIAAQEGQEEVVKLLLDAPNVRIDACKTGGATPLMVAAGYGFFWIVEQLIKRGADVNPALDSGTTALSVAARSGHVEVVRVLLQAPAIEINHTTKAVITALSNACAKGHLDVVTLLLEKGADPNITHESGMGPLHMACLRGHTAIVEILLDAGADMDGQLLVRTADAGSDSFTPYVIAELIGHREIMTLLEQHRQARSARAVQVETLPPCLRPQGQVPEDEPGRPSPSTPPEPASLPAIAPATQAEQVHSTPPVAAESRATGGLEPADRAPPGALPESAVAGSGPAPPEPGAPLALGKQELVQEILRKLEQDNLEPLQGIRLLVEVRASASIDGLCGIYNRLAGIERQRERSRRRGVRRGGFSIGMEQTPARVGAPTFALEGKSGMDAEGIEEEIKGYVEQAHHRFVSQAVNDMEYGRGKLTTRYTGLWHASAGIAGVGSCSVFYYVHEETQVIRIVGIGHHVGRAAYRLDYAAEGLGRSGQTLRIA